MLEIVLEEYRDIFDTIEKDTWIEPRMCAFKIKEDSEEEFKLLFNKYFSNDFVLKTKDEVVKECLFGIYKENEYFYDSLGGFFALAVGDKYFRYRKTNEVFKSTHAGFTIDEMKIPLIIIDK